jgi:hypothetical protein
MSLMRLLSSGKSWVGLKDSGIRYRMTDPRAMPKFGSDKNRFHTSAKSPPAQTQCPEPAARFAKRTETAALAGVVQPEECFSSSDVPAPANVLPAGAAAPRAKEEPEQARAVKAKRVAQVKSAGIKAAQVLRQAKAALLSKLHWLIMGRRNRPTRPARGPLTEPAVQGELSLDKIKVVRNDLSDADLEIVPARPKATPVNVETAMQT